MALITCPECGAKISSETRTCPRCGASMLAWKRGPIATFFHWAAITEVSAMFLVICKLAYHQHFVTYPSLIAAGKAGSPEGEIFSIVFMAVVAALLNGIIAVPLFIMGSCHRVHRVTGLRIFED